MLSSPGDDPGDDPGGGGESYIYTLNANEGELSGGTASGSIAYGDGKFVAVGASGKAAYWVTP